ncbi:MAG: GTP cyclohydrolase I [Pseudomonadales bacterium]|nr:GTP cyclohydrolase I [Pseudomonadales bacterium]
MSFSIHLRVFTCLPAVHVTFTIATLGCLTLKVELLMNSVVEPVLRKAIEQNRMSSCKPVSERIRARLEAAGERYFANDNIRRYMHADEVEELQHEVKEKLQEVLKSLVIDVENDHNTQDTAKRVAKMFVQEVFAGRYAEQPAVTEFPNVSRLNELMIVGPIAVRSACSHHLCPIMGKIWVGVLPDEDSALIGLSKYARLVDWVMSRPQIQEEAIAQLADVLEEKMAPDGLAIVMEADHYCMHWRGVKDTESKMINSVMRGAFRSDADLRREFLTLKK